MTNTTIVKARASEIDSIHTMLDGTGAIFSGNSADIIIDMDEVDMHDDNVADEEELTNDMKNCRIRLVEMFTNKGHTAEELEADYFHVIKYNT